jgi:hypothetical protein
MMGIADLAMKDQQDNTVGIHSRNEDPGIGAVVDLSTPSIHHRNERIVSVDQSVYLCWLDSHIQDEDLEAACPFTSELPDHRGQTYLQD